MYILLGVMSACVLIVLFEYRIRRPDRFILYESKGKIKRRKGRIYPRHLSLSIPIVMKSTTIDTEVEAKGKLGLKIRLSLSVIPAIDHIEALIRVGGWSEDVVTKTIQELNILAESLLGEITEKFEIQDITAEKISEKLRAHSEHILHRLGLELISVTIHAIDPSDSAIAEAIKQQENARIQEETEKMKQKARVEAAKVKIKADRDIAQSENMLELEKITMNQKQDEQEALLAKQRVHNELERRKMRLSIDEREVQMLRNNPELLMLTPQITRLAEASQNLRNARTIVSVSGSDINESTPLQTLISVLINNLQKTLENSSNKVENK